MMLPTTRHRDATTPSRPRFGHASRLLQDEWDQLLRHTRRHRRHVSKNCKNLRKYGYTYIGFRSNTTNRQERQMVETLTRQVMELERRRALLESMDLARFANIRQHAMACLDTYYERFRHGYDPLHSESLDAMVRSILTEDCESPSFPDIDTFLRQWSVYSTYHASMTITIESITSVPDAENTNNVLIQCKGLTTSRISRATIQHLFKPILNDEVLVQQLIGREYSFSFCTLFHFNTQGRVARMEPRAELATGLLNLISDPFTTVKLLGASRLSADGYLHAYEEE